MSWRVCGSAASNEIPSVLSTISPARYIRPLMNARAGVDQITLVILALLTNVLNAGLASTDASSAVVADNPGDSLCMPVVACVAGAALRGAEAGAVAGLSAKSSPMFL